MAYSSWSVSFGEQPSTAKWNILGTNDASFNNGTGIANLATNVTSISNPYKFRARRSTAQTTTGGAFTKIQFATEDFDTNNNYDNATNYRYTAPVSGFYQVNARCSGNGNTQLVIALYKNGSVYQRGSHNSVNAVDGVVYSDLVQLTAADYIEIFLFGDTGVALETSAGSQSYFSAYLVSQT